MSDGMSAVVVLLVVIIILLCTEQEERGKMVMLGMLGTGAFVLVKAHLWLFLRIAVFVGFSILMFFLWRGVKILAEVIDRTRRRNNWGLYTYYGGLVLPPLAVFCVSLEWTDNPNPEIRNLVAVVALGCLALAFIVGTAFMRSGDKPPVSKEPDSADLSKRRTTPFNDCK